MIRKSLLSLALSVCCAYASASDLYTVARGDTLYSIAKQYHVGIRELQRANNLRSPRINPGQQLRIPGVSVEQIASSNNPTAHQSYTVRRGDTLGTIAKRHGISVAALQQNNRMRNSLIHPGQVLFVPSGNGQAVAAAPRNQAAASVHVVRNGDSLWEISRRYRISMATLSSFNGIAKNAALRPGQQIRIPASGSIAPSGPQKTYSRIASNGAKLPYTESQSVIVVDAQSGKTLFEKNTGEVKSIASITKLMTAMVTLDAGLPMQESLSITNADVDRVKMSSSRLPPGTSMTRERMLHLALMSSENRAASALSRHYPGGQQAFYAAMNAKAKALGMNDSYFADSTGLTPRNVSTAADLAKMVAAASKYDVIRRYTTDTGELVRTNKAGTLQYNNTNGLVRANQWHIHVSKTGYIREAGRCLVMKADIANRPAYMIFLESSGRYSPTADAQRVKKWLESGASGINLAGL
jgi:serine-type D-Ala-D-Ala endopeptidase (penicillin-binding protein 7)